MGKGKKEKKSKKNLKKYQYSDFERSGSKDGRHGKHVKDGSKGDKYSVSDYKTRIQAFLARADGNAVSPKALSQMCYAKKGSLSAYKKALESLIKTGTIYRKKQGFVLSSKTGFYKAQIKRINKTFGFAEKEEDQTEVFIPGKFLLGALPGDKVLMTAITSRGQGPEGRVVDILEQMDAVLCGTIIEEDGKSFALCDTISKTPLAISKSDSCKYNTGDRVLAKITHRGKRHQEHKVCILFSYGTSDRAEHCADSLIDSEMIPFYFPDDVTDQARTLENKGIADSDYTNRQDIRKTPVFTIDSAHSKDLDDAVSISEDDEGFDLGVHIADVSNYVKYGTPIDKEAINRGTSIYYADKVIPMLPVELSNGICSLNPNAPRLALSCFMRLDKSGNLLNFNFEKTVILSRVKGVYTEVNDIINGTASPQITQKYSEVLDEIKILDKLCSLRQTIRKKRGAPEIETIECEYKIEDGVCVDVCPRQRGRSEEIIEEMMLLANESAAKFAQKNNLPFVYRVHTTPSDEKIENLKQTLLKLGILNNDFSGTVSPSDFANILSANKDKDFFPVLNNIVLRSMSKAEYSDQPLGHFGLNLKDYAHFTSPIRRYSDLAVHRIISKFLANEINNKNITKLETFAKTAADAATKTEVRAQNAERKCDHYYEAEYMKGHVGECYEALVSGIAKQGVYAEIPNGIEGLISIHDLPQGEYDIDEGFEMREIYSNTRYRVGDKIMVRCTRSDIATGNIDFEIEEV